MNINPPKRNSGRCTRESDLYDPIKQFLIARGFLVRGEVRDCDVVAVRDDVTVVVELKNIFNLALVFQGIDRQTMTPYVYLGVEAPATAHRRAQWKDVQRLCGRLGLGLLAVHFSELDGSVLDVEVVREPIVSPPRKNNRRRKLLTEEFQQRSGDYTKGGSPSGEIVITAYRELALHVAVFLHTYGESRLRDIREAIPNKKVPTLVSRNYYGWFQRVSRGVYRITAEGETALHTYREVLGKGKARAE